MRQYLPLTCLSNAMHVWLPECCLTDIAALAMWLQQSVNFTTMHLAAF